jgi:LysR family glycine cleavage system transcriptional activator
MRPNLVRGLAVFCTAARYLSFKLAAEELCITPSAVSHQIKTLEDRLGAALFERRTRAIHLTTLGAALYAQLDPHIRSLDAITSSFLKTTRHRRLLRITMPPFFASEIVLPRISEFTKQDPSIELGVDTSVGSEDEFPSGSDAAILLTSEEPAGVHARLLFGLELVPACAPHVAQSIDRKNPGSLNECTLIVHEARTSAWSDWFKKAGSRFDADSSVIVFDSMLAVTRAAEQGAGVALVPVPLSATRFRNESLERLFEATLDTGEHYYFTHRLENDTNPDVVSLGEWVAKVCAQHD